MYYKRLSTLITDIMKKTRSGNNNNNSSILTFIYIIPIHVI